MEQNNGSNSVQAVVLTPGGSIRYATLAAGAAALAALIGTEEGNIKRLAELPGIPKGESEGALKFYGRADASAENAEETIVLPAKNDEGDLDAGGAIGYGTIVVAAETDGGALREFSEREREGVEAVFPRMMDGFTLFLAAIAGEREDDDLLDDEIALDDEIVEEVAVAR